MKLTNQIDQITAEIKEAEKMKNELKVIFTEGELSAIEQALVKEIDLYEKLIKEEEEGFEKLELQYDDPYGEDDSWTAAEIAYNINSYQSQLDTYRTVLDKIRR